MKPMFEQFKKCLISATRDAYGDNLVTLAVYGSWARGVATPASDIDLLIIAENLPAGRFKRMAQFAPVENKTSSALAVLWNSAWPAPELSPVIKTQSETQCGSPLFLDMTEWCYLLVDQDNFFQKYLDGLRERMRRNGTCRVPTAGGYYWLYKPSAKPGEVITL